MWARPPLQELTPDEKRSLASYVLLAAYFDLRPERNPRRVEDQEPGVAA